MMITHHLPPLAPRRHCDCRYFVKTKFGWFSTASVLGLCSGCAYVRYVCVQCFPFRQSWQPGLIPTTQRTQTRKCTTIYTPCRRNQGSLCASICVRWIPECFIETIMDIVGESNPLVQLTRLKFPYFLAESALASLGRFISSLEKERRQRVCLITFKATWLD